MVNASETLARTHRNCKLEFLQYYLRRCHMAKSQDAKKNVKKAPKRTPDEKRALKQEKKKNKAY